MHPMINAIYAGDGESDPKIWSKEKGWLVEPESLIHGQEVWGEHKGSEKLIHLGHQGRAKMKFDKPSGNVVFPEMFARIQSKCVA